MEVKVRFVSFRDNKEAWNSIADWARESVEKDEFREGVVGQMTMICRP